MESNAPPVNNNIPMNFTNYMYYQFIIKILK